MKKAYYVKYDVTLTLKEAAALNPPMHGFCKPRSTIEAYDTKQSALNRVNELEKQEDIVNIRTNAEEQGE